MIKMKIVRTNYLIFLHKTNYWDILELCRAIKVKRVETIE